MSKGRTQRTPRFRRDRSEFLCDSLRSAFSCIANQDC